MWVTLIHPISNLEMNCGSNRIPGISDSNSKEENNVEENSELEFHCSKCEFQTNRNCYLVKHEQSQHVKFSCNKCKYQGNKAKLLLMHDQKMHRNVWLRCEQCDLWMYLACNVCPYLAPTKGHLVNHKQRVHEGVRYPCRYCDHKATTKHGLRKHDFAKHLDKRS